MNELVDRKYKYYLRDLGNLLKEKALEAQQFAQKELQGTEGYHLESGRLTAYYEVISLMQQQAQGFQIPLEELDLHDIEPDRDLI